MLKNFISNLHNSTKRKYLKRMINNKVLCISEAKIFKKLLGWRQKIWVWRI